jgi:tetratricopeptide (TPR) repeat protein
LRFKQHRFRESLADFLLFKQYAGPSAHLAENMGHTYNTLGDFINAEACFQESLKLMDRPEAPAKDASNRGGVLLGLGLVRERLGRTEEGLATLNEALAFYRHRFKGQIYFHLSLSLSLPLVSPSHSLTLSFTLIPTINAHHNHRPSSYLK